MTEKVVFQTHVSGAPLNFEGVRVFGFIRCTSLPFQINLKLYDDRSRYAK